MFSALSPTADMAGNVYEFTPWPSTQAGLANGSRERVPDDKLRVIRRSATAAGAKTASVGGLYPPFALAPLAPRRIDFAARLRGLLYRPESGALARRTFELSRLR
jgi:hypothetical protein